MKRGVLSGALCACVAVAAGAQTAADGWITHAGAETRAPVVLEFRRDISLERVPEMLSVAVTADNRFILRVNGYRVASGPSTGTIKSWRYATVDLAPFLRTGANEITATVWNF